MTTIQKSNRSILNKNDYVSNDLRTTLFGIKK